MTRLIDLPTLSALVRRQGPAQFLRLLAAQIQADFLRWPQFEKNARLAHHCPQGVVELMPISDGVHYSFKYVNGHPGNPALGLPTVMAFGVLADMASGAPLLLCEATLLTALRTAATSALAARALAQPGSRRMALIGNGAQGEFQALAFHALLGIEQLVLYDRNPQASARLQRNLEALAPLQPPLRIEIAPSVAAAVAGADIITTATAAKARSSLLTPAMLRPGLHLNAIGGDCPGKTELPPEVLRAAHIFVEYPPQTRVEGEIQQLAPTHPVTELWQVLAGEQPGRRSAQDITLFDSVGFALEDHAALCLVQRLAQEQRIGHDIDLVPGAGQAQDLFARLL